MIPVSFQLENFRSGNLSFPQPEEFEDVSVLFGDARMDEEIDRFSVFSAARQELFRLVFVPKQGKSQAGKKKTTGKYILVVLLFRPSAIITRHGWIQP